MLCAEKERKINMNTYEKTLKLSYIRDCKYQENEIKVTSWKTRSNLRRNNRKNLKHNVKTEQCQKAEIKDWIAQKTGSGKCKAVAPRLLFQTGCRSVVA